LERSEPLNICMKEFVRRGLFSFCMVSRLMPAPGMPVLNIPKPAQREQIGRGNFVHGKAARLGDG
jgi:hypothetical protein